MNTIKKLTVSNLNKDKNLVGKKVYNNIYFLKNKIKIPKSYYINFKTYDEYHSNKNATIEKIKKDLEQIIENKTYVVRSSINLEDLDEKSFAGQFKTFLNLNSKNEILEAITKIYDEIVNEKNQNYLEKFSDNNYKVSLLIQEQIHSEFSGVVFTRNPVNYLNEIIIEYIEGYGELLVDKGITPERWKYNWEMWVEKPLNPKLNEETLNKIKGSILQIKKNYKFEIDAEWTISKGELYFLQIRPITTIKNINIYSNNISKEFLPGLIKPLVWSINIPVVNGAWKKLFENFIKKDSVSIHNLAKSIHYRAYFNMGVIGDIFQELGMPRELLELLMGIYPKPPKNMFKPSLKTMKYLPKMLIFIIKNINFSSQARKVIKIYTEKLETYKKLNFESLSKTETISTIDKLIQDTEKLAYFNIVTPLFDSFRTSSLKKYIEKEGYSSEILKELSNQAEIKNIDPNYHLDLLKKELSEKEESFDFKTKVDNFIEQFGLLSDSGNDFSKQQWRENRELIIDMIKSQEIQIKNEIDIPDDKKLKKKLKKAKESHLLKEKISFLYTNLYQIFRPLFLRLSDIFVSENLLDEKDDIFYVEYEKLKKETFTKDEIKNIKEDMKKKANMVLPSTILGDDVPDHFINEESSFLKGVPVSKGYYTGKVCIIKGISDFSKVKKGDIIVIPYSDISWNPIFYKAGAIISESGGILSHSAIIARELGIPAIVSVENAQSILKEGQNIFIDANQGLIGVLN
jgi:pyruvate,water dikinase